jgi:transposase
MRTIPFVDPIRRPTSNRITLLGIGPVRFHEMDIPEGKIKCANLVKRASGWYLCLVIDAESKPIERVAYGEIGIDPGFKNLLTTSTGDVIVHPRELEAGAKRLAQSQRGRNKRLSKRLYERIGNRIKDRNHKISRQLISENSLIGWSRDPIQKMSHRFGKNVMSSGHGQLRVMLSYKSPKSGTRFVEVACKGSTMTCSACGANTGPKGWAGLKVRHWECIGCGALHDRDRNSAINTLKAAAGYVDEGCAAA